MVIRSSEVTFILSYVYLIVDSLNSQLLTYLSLSISPIYKLVILLLMLHYLTSLKKYVFLYYFIPFTIILMLHFIFYKNILFLYDDFMWAVKFLMIIVSFYFFKHKILQSPNTEKKIDFLFKISFLVIAINIFLGLLGFGHSLYGRENIGTKGFFIAGNELGILLTTCAMYILARLITERTVLKYFLFSIFYLFISMNIGSKVAVLGAIILIVSFPIIDLIKRSKLTSFNKTSFKLSSIIFLFIVVAGPFTIYYLLYEMNLIVRMGFFFQKFDFLTFILSGRNLRAEELFNFIVENFTVYNFLYGFSLGHLKYILSGTSEIDLVDLFFVFGFFGLLITYGFFILVLMEVRKFKKNKYSVFILFSAYLLIFLSLLSGHVMMSGLSGILIGALFSLMYIKNSNTYGEVINEKIGNNKHSLFSSCRY